LKRLSQILKEVESDPKNKRAQHEIATWHALAGGDLSRKATWNLSLLVKDWSLWVNDAQTHNDISTRANKEFIIEAYTNALVELDRILSGGAEEAAAIKTVDFGKIIQELVPKYAKTIISETKFKEDITNILTQLNPKSTRWWTGKTEYSSKGGVYQSRQFIIESKGITEVKFPDWTQQHPGEYQAFIKESAARVTLNESRVVAHHRIEFEFYHWKEDVIDQFKKDVIDFFNQHQIVNRWQR